MPKMRSLEHANVIGVRLETFISANVVHSRSEHVKNVVGLHGGVEGVQAISKTVVYVIASRLSI